MSLEDEPAGLDEIFRTKSPKNNTVNLENAYSDVSSETSDIKIQLLEERLCWIVWSIILLDIIFFDKVSVWTVPIVIVALELVLLLVISTRLGVTETKILLYRLIDTYAGKKKTD